MRVLQITNNYSGSEIYKNLCSQLDKKGIEQIVYTPIRDSKLIGKNSITFENSYSKIIYSNLVNKTTDRLFYHKKINKIVRDIENNVDLSAIDLIHAHTWYSDGGVAHEIFKKYGIPYVIAIRNTDLNIFEKYLFYLRKYGQEILENASKIVFISPIYLEKFLKIRLYKDLYSDIESRIAIIPNGIDSFWIHNAKRKKSRCSYPVNLLYVGNFTPNKNVDRLMKAVTFLNKDMHRYNLRLVGEITHNERMKYKIRKYFKYLGAIKDREKLQNVYSDSDIFTMPSKSETFGLVYIEALSQGLPILYTKNEGIDKAYDNVGEAVNPYDVKDIIRGIETIANNYHRYNFNSTQIVENHNWMTISNRYLKIYDTILSNIIKGK